jgi:CRISPR-associated protein Cmr1
MFNIARFKDIEKREYGCEVVTPLFLGGADPKKAELRVPPIKAAMRFWWRALYGSNDIEDMAKKESEIFGSTEQKATLKIQVISKELNLSQEKLDRGNFNIYEYLAYGYRVGNNIKGYFVDGRFKIQIYLKKADKDEITNSLGFLVHYGGLGSKSRNGFGCLHCQDINPPVFNHFNSGSLKTFTALSAQSLLFDGFNEKTTWKEALAEVGDAYKNGRFELKNSRMDRSLIAKPFDRDHSRHAKPYFLHVRKTKNNKYKGQILYLPYEYHDERKRQDYFRTCQKMNKSLEQYLGGAK